MEEYSFIAAKATLIILTIVLFAEYAIRRRQVGRDRAQNRHKQQQLAEYSAELKELKKELARKSEIAEKLPQITKKFTEKLPPDAYPAVAVRSVLEFFHAKRVGYFAPVQGGIDYTLVVGAGFPPDWLGKVRIDPGDGILGLALLRKIVVSRTDPDSPGRRSSHRSLEDMGVIPDLVAPLLGTSGTAGAIVVEGCPFPLDQERAYISMLADQLSTMLQNAALLDSSRNAAWMDPLTGVANRLYFLRRFEIETRRTKNYEQALALFMFDIDEFKKVNDTYGHHAGDVVIREMAEIAKKNSRRSDLIARFGGDEFIMLITSTTEEQAVSFANKLREMLAAAHIRIPETDSPLRITISGGLAMYPTHGQSTTELFRAADQALYESKRNGRNRITVAPSLGLHGGTTAEKETDRKGETLKDTMDETDSGLVEFALGEVGGKLRD